MSVAFTWGGEGHLPGSVSCILKGGGAGHLPWEAAGSAGFGWGRGSFSLQLLNPRLGGSRLLGSSCRPILEVTWRRREWGGGVLIFISDPSFPLSFFFFFWAKSGASRFHLVHPLLSLLEKRQEHRCALAGPAPQPGALAGGASSRGFRAEGGAATPALRSSGAPLPPLPGPASL